MRFILLAVSAVAWSVLVIRWTVSRGRSRGRGWVIGASTLVFILAAVSITGDLSPILRRFRAPDSGVAIVIQDMGSWLRLTYTRGGTSFVTANEVHVPAGAAVTMEWHGPALIAWSARDFLPVSSSGALFIAGDAGVDNAWLIRLRPSPRRRRLRIVADSRVAFERWFDNESEPARSTARTSLFTDCGCSYCHVIRGVAERPWKVAPDLTHFAARQTIAATSLPNRRGYLAGWVVNSRALKAGSEMPPNPLEPSVLNLLLRDLDTLR